MESELYWNEDHTAYAVLVSKGFGAGWSSWEGSELAYDARVVKFWLDHKDNEKWMHDVDSCRVDNPAVEEAKTFFKKEFNLDYIYMGGFSDIVLEWVPAGTYWRIDEYDGAESIEYLDTREWNIFY